MKIPKGWLNFKPYGEKVEGTQLFPFKTPLRKEITCGRIPEEKWFTPALLMEVCPQLKLVIDLTNCSNPNKKYYCPDEFRDADVDYRKIRIPGGGQVPSSERLKEFFMAVDDFVMKHSNDPDALIGVHCTHGLNRTGYFICKYMVTRMKFEPAYAIAKFQEARGHEMYRQNYVEDILAPGSVSNRRNRPDYSGPSLKCSSAGSSSDNKSKSSRPSSSADPPSTKRENWRLRDPIDSLNENQYFKSFQRYNRKTRETKKYDDSKPFTGNFHRNPKIFGDDFY